MKEFEGKATWTASEWGEEFPDAVTVIQGASSWIVMHEDQVEHLIPNAPDDLKAYVRREVLKHRPLAEDEKRTDRYTIQLRITGRALERRYLWLDGYSSQWGQFFSNIDLPATDPIDAEVFAFAQAWRDSQWQDVEGAEGYAVKKRDDDACDFRDPFGTEWTVLRQDLHAIKCWIESHPQPVIRACCKLLGVEREERLADNQVKRPSNVWTLRWRQGKRQYRPEYVDHWIDWAPCPGDNDSLIESCNAWFRANCPPDRFVTDSGKVLEFRINDAGEAEARHKGEVVAWTFGSGGPIFNIFTTKRSEAESVAPSLYAFRDAEWGKWRFECFDAGEQSFIRVCKNDGRDYAFPNWECGSNWSQKALRELPAWARRRDDVAGEEGGTEGDV